MGSITASSYILAALGCGSLFFAVTRRSARTTATTLLGVTLFALFYHYMFFAVDALDGSKKASLWAAAGQFMLYMFWSSLCAFLISAIAPRLPDLFKDTNVRWAALSICLIFSYGLFLGCRVVWAVYTHVPAPQLETYILRLTQYQPVGMWFVLPITLLLGAPSRLNPETPDFTDWFVGRNRVSLISLRIAPERKPEPGGLPFSLSDLRALSGAAAAGLVVFTIFSVDQPVVLLILRLLLLGCMMGVIYFQARFTFFDVIIKRGLVYTALALAVGCITYLAPLPGWSAAEKTMLCVGATVFASVWSSFAEFAERALDRVVFRRPDYQRELATLSVEMANCQSAESLAQVIPQRLGKLLHAPTAYTTTRPPVAEAVVRIGAPNRARGYLALGKRDRGQPYASEDLAFLEAVAGQFSAQMETLEAQRSAQLVAEAEIRALRAQINPHFLFNTLNTAAELAKGTPKVERLILNLARVFHNTLRSSLEDRISLREDLAAVRALLEIEAVRFDGKLEFSIDAPEELLEARIAPLLIQPLVENAVQHGIAEKIATGFVRVVVDRSRVTVLDNGVGFDPAATAVNVGLSNVRARVEREGGTFELQSVPGEGTTVSFEWQAA